MTELEHLTVVHCYSGGPTKIGDRSNCQGSDMIGVTVKEVMGCCDSKCIYWL